MREAWLEAGDLRFRSGFGRSCLGGNRARVHADQSEAGAADPIGEEDSESQCGEAGTYKHEKVDCVLHLGPALGSFWPCR